VPPLASVDALGVFTGLWAQVMVLQVVKLAIKARSAGANQPAAIAWLALMASAVAFGVLLPERGEATVFLNAAGLLVLSCTGSQSNHVILEMVVCVAILVTYSANRKRWLAQATHAVRLFLVVLYWVTGLHKLNSDWDNNALSCCNHMIGGLLALPPLNFNFMLDNLPIGLFPYFTAVTELTLPILLLRSGKSLRYATVVAALFHLPIGMMLPPMSVYPFSLLMAPLYVFVIPSQASAVFGRVKGWVACLVVAVACQKWTALMAPELEAGTEPFEYPAYGCWAAGIVWCIGVYSMLVFAAVSDKNAKEVCSSTPTWRGRFVALFVLVFGLSPYLGIRNYPALAMFSNLRTEGGRSNHAFLGDDFDLIGWQRDYVTVHETNIRVLELAQVDLAPLYTRKTKKTLNFIYAERQFWLTPPLEAWPNNYTRPMSMWKPYSMPFLELRRRLAPLRAAGSEGTVLYTRTLARAKLRYPGLWQRLGKENLEADKVTPNITYDLSVGGDAELEEPLPWWLAVVARWRTFDVEYSPCRH